METFAQGTFFKAAKSFAFKVPGARGKPINVRVGDLFWIVTPQYEQKRTGIVGIARKGKNMGFAYHFPLNIFVENFAVAS